MAAGIKGLILVLPQLTMGMDSTSQQHKVEYQPQVVADWNIGAKKFPGHVGNLLSGHMPSMMPPTRNTGCFEQDTITQYIQKSLINGRPTFSYNLKLLWIVSECQAEGESPGCWSTRRSRATRALHRKTHHPGTFHFVSVKSILLLAYVSEINQTAFYWLNIKNIKPATIN